MPHPLTNDADIARRARDMRAAGKSPHAVCAALAIPRAVYDGFQKADTGVPLDGDDRGRIADAATLERIVKLRDAGWSYRAIARQLGISHPTVSKLLKQHKIVKDWRAR